MIIAIDGPAGSGKSTVAKNLAKRLNFFYLDTGAMYRTLTLKALNKNIDLENENALIREARNFNIEFREGRIFLDLEDVTSKIREPLVDKSISKVARIPQVREELVKIQRKIASCTNCIAEGRDTTTVVFPEAELKIFLDADFKERVKRRYLDFKNKGIDIELKDLEQDLKKRDEADINRKVGALKRAEDSIYLDTTNLSIDEVVEKIYSLVLEKVDGKK